MKSFGVTSVLLLVLIVAGPSAADAQVLRPGELCRDHSDAAIATFEDANLEARVRSALSVGAQDDLTCGLVSGLMVLDAGQAGIASLVGIQNLTSLTNLNLDRNSITDLSALSGLHSVTDLSLYDNSITDIHPLSSLTRLRLLVLQRNSITDVSPLGELTELTSLLLGENSITDIGALDGLTSLASVNLNDTNASCGEVTALEAKGVAVASGCALRTAAWYGGPGLDVRPSVEPSPVLGGGQVHLLQRDRLVNIRMDATRE